MLTDSVSAVEKLCLVKSDFFGNGSFANELGAEEHELKEEWRTFGDTDDRGALTENGDASSPPASTWGRTSLTELFWLSSRSATIRRHASRQSSMSKRNTTMFRGKPGADDAEDPKIAAGAGAAGPSNGNA